MNKNFDVLIIGAGPSGCVAASYLHNKGLNVKVVEKSKFPRFVIGESLLPRSMDHFDESGLLECLIDCGFEKKYGARFLKKDLVCNFSFDDKHTDGWNWTWQVPRADFDSVLTNQLIKRGIDIEFEHGVIDIEFDELGESKTTIQNKNGDTYKIKAKYVIDSSGWGRVLPKLLDLDMPSKLENRGSIFTHIEDINRPLGNEGTQITFDVIDNNTWFWVIPFSNGITSIGFVGLSDFLNSFKGTSSEKMIDLLKLSKYFYTRFNNIEFLFEPKELQNYSKSVKQFYGKGYVLTGNSAEFLDPVFSSGVAFATESALKAAKLIFKEVHNEPVDWEKEYSDYIKYGVNVFRTYVKEWYTGNLQTLFFHKQSNPLIKRQICSVLAGYVWDKTNPFVTKHDKLVKNLAYIINSEKESSKVNFSN